MIKYSLAETISKQLQLNKNTIEFKEVYAYCISYLTNGLTAFQFQRLLPTYLPKGLSAKVFRLSLLKNKYNYFTLKLFVLHLCRIKKFDHDSLHALTKKMGVSVKDSNRIYDLWLSSPKFRSRVKQWVKNLPPEATYDPTELEQDFAHEVYPVIMKKIKSLTYNKLRFIAKSSNIDLSDLHSELVLKSVQTYYKLVPSSKGVLYVINYLKQTIHNHAMNMINTATTQKSGRLVCTGLDMHNDRIFSLLTVSENQMVMLSDNTDGEGDMSYQNQLYCSNDPTEDLENEICMSTILDKYKRRTKKYRLLMILMGTYDEQFTEWLRNRKHCNQHEDNSDLQERLGTLEFRKLISQFLHINDDQVNVFLITLGKSMTEKSPAVKHKDQYERKPKPAYEVIATKPSYPAYVRKCINIPRKAYGN